MPSFVDDSASDIRLQSDASLSKRSIHYAYAMDWITGWEDSFCIDVGSKESEDGFKLTEKQLAKRILINAKFLAAFDQCAANLAL